MHDPQEIKKLGLSTIPADVSEPVADFSEKALGEDASDDIDKVSQPQDRKSAETRGTSSTNPAKKMTKLAMKKLLLQKAGLMADSLSMADCVRIGAALLKD